MSLRKRLQTLEGLIAQVNSPGAREAIYRALTDEELGAEPGERA